MSFSILAGDHQSSRGKICEGLCVHNYYAHMLIHLHDIENEKGLFEKTMGDGIGTVHEILIHP